MSFIDKQGFPSPISSYPEIIQLAIVHNQASAETDKQTDRQSEREERECMPSGGGWGWGAWRKLHDSPERPALWRRRNPDKDKSSTRHRPMNVVGGSSRHKRHRLHTMLRHNEYMPAASSFATKR